MSYNTESQPYIKLYVNQAGTARLLGELQLSNVHFLPRVGEFLTCPAKTYTRTEGVSSYLKVTHISHGINEDKIVQITVRAIPVDDTITEEQLERESSN